MKSLIQLVFVFFVTWNCDFCYGILSGYPIEIQQAPYQVYIQTLINASAGIAEQCGGSIIKERRQSVMGTNGFTTTRYAKFILTAGHCVILGDDNQRASPSDVSLFYGTTDVSQATYDNFINGVQQIHVHPQYNGTVANGHDVAILELRSELKLDDTTSRAIPLNSGTYFAPGTRTLVSGYGTNPNNTGSTHLYQAELEVYSSEECAKAYPRETEEQLRQEQICALGPAPDYANVCPVRLNII